MLLLKRSIFSLLLLLVSFAASAARLYGTITDEANKPLPFVTVYIEWTGGNMGTGSNSDGNYAVDLANGSYSVSYRFIGYKTVSRQVQVQGKDVRLDIQMTPEVIALQEVEITNRKEDPAYEIIRQAQAKRRFYLEQVKAFSARSYVKGLQRITEAPKKILGKDVVLPGVHQDSANAGIVYFSESISKYHYQHPDKKKEEMISSKVSGRSNAFSWNSALNFDINFYENSLKIEGLSPRPFISPIAATAMLHYRYEYIGSTEDNGITVNKIKVIPKQKGSPLYGGFIYIQEDTWRIHSADLTLTKDAGIDFVDTLYISQVNIPVTKDVWRIGMQRFSFNWKFDMFKIKGNGYFIGVFSDYNLEPRFDKNFFSGELIKVNEDANKKDSLYWEQMRPVALTLEETKDYHQKDSIFKVYESKSFKDSLDRKNNKFKPINLLLGYTYQNSYRNYNLEFSSLLQNLQLNTVEGYVVNLRAGYYSSNKEKYSQFSWENDIRYGFQSRKFYLQSGIYRRFNGTNRLNVRVQGGQFISQFNEVNPISFFINSIYTGLLEENYLKIYEKTFGRVSGGMEVINGIRLTTSLEYAHRVPLVNAALPVKGHYIDHKDKNFSSNNPLNPITDIPVFSTHNALLFAAQLNIRFGQKYISRPRHKLIIDSKYPEVTVAYRKGIKAFNSTTNFDQLSINITDDMSFGQVGTSSYAVTFGTFLNRKNVPFMDYTHFNTSQTIFSNNVLTSFFLLPYYTYSTTDGYAEGHYEHHFNGFMLNRISPIRKLKWQAVAGAHLLYTKDSREYIELTAGLENLFRVGRIDFAASYRNGRLEGKAIRLRIML